MINKICHPQKKAIFRSRLLTLYFLVGAIGSLCISGCGREVYLDRVEETSRYFRRLADRDSFLSKDVWRSEWVSLRIPLRFVPNVDEKNALKQPVPFNIPGLLGSWNSRLETGKVANEKDGFLFLADSRRPSGEDIDVDDLEQTLIERISTVFSIDIKTIEQSQMSLTFPPELGVVDRVEYVAYEFEIPESIAEFDGAYRGQLFFHRMGNRKIAILFLSPKDISTGEKKRVERAISFSLETLSVVK